MKDNLSLLNMAHITVSVGMRKCRSIYIRIDLKKQSVSLNGERINIDINEFVEKLLNILDTWPREWNSNDSPERPYYAIHIRKINGKTQLYQGTDKFQYPF